MEDRNQVRAQNPLDTTKLSITKMVLGDGKEYELAPVTLNFLVALEDKYEGSATEILSGGRVKPLRFLTTLRLQKSNPRLTEEEVGELITMDVLLKVAGELGVKI